MSQPGFNPTAENPGTAYTIPVGHSITSASDKILVPFTTAMSADASANYSLEFVDQQQVTMTGIQQEFNVTLDASDSILLLNAFTVTDESADSSGNNLNSLGVVFTGGDNTGLATDKEKQSKALSLALSHAIARATNVVVTGSGVLANAWMTAELKKQLDADIEVAFEQAFSSSNLSATLLGALDFSHEDVALDISGGESLFETTLNGTPSHALMMYEQIPAAKINAYTRHAIDGEPLDSSGNANAPVTDALPLHQGDTVTLVFDVTTNAVSFIQTFVAADVTGTAGGSAFATGDSQAAGPLEAASDSDGTSQAGPAKAVSDQSAAAAAAAGGVGGGASTGGGSGQAAYVKGQYRDANLTRVSYTPDTVRIAFNLKLTETGSGAFPVAANPTPAGIQDINTALRRRNVVNNGAASSGNL